MTEIISGWKKIAKVLDVCERTARRYEKHCNLPVVRIKTGFVKARIEDLRRWLEDQEEAYRKI